MKRLWPIVLPIKEDELLSSWLIRNSLANGSDPMTWTWYFWGKWRAWTRDFDRYCPDDKLKCISFGRYTFEELRAATLQHTLMNITHTQLEPNSRWPWLIPQGTRNRDRSIGIRFCPECLKEDPAYFRRSWRLAWNHSCPIHNIVLSNHCPSCGLPVSPHKANQDHPDICICPRCTYDLRTVKTSKASSEALLAQTLLSDASKNSTQLHPWGITDTRDFFDTVYLIIGLFQYIASHPKQMNKLQTALDLPDYTELKMTGIGIEKRSPEWTSALFEALNKLLTLNIGELTQFFADNGLTQNALIANHPKPTRTLSLIASKLPINNIHSSAPKKHKKPSIKPRTKDEVFEMWLELKRYL